MFGTLRNPAAAYRKAGLESQVETASPHQLVLMLFDGAIQQVSTAATHLAGNDMARKGEAIGRAIDIIDTGLKACLDYEAGGELSVRLGSLYEYMCHRLLHANLRNDAAALAEVKQLLGELKAAWEEIANDPAAVSVTRNAA